MRACRLALTVRLRGFAAVAGRWAAVTTALQTGQYRAGGWAE